MRGVIFLLVGLIFLVGADKVREEDDDVKYVTDLLKKKFAKDKSKSYIFYESSLIILLPLYAINVEGVPPGHCSEEDQYCSTPDQLSQGSRSRRSNAPILNVFGDEEPRMPESKIKKAEGKCACVQQDGNNCTARCLESNTYCPCMNCKIITQTCSMPKPS